jgi:hypothetical protein
LLALLQARPAISTSFCVASALVLLAATTLFEVNPGGTAATMPGIDAQLANTPNPPLTAQTRNDSGYGFVTNFAPAGFALELSPATRRQQPTNSMFESPLFQRIDFNQPYVEPIW